MSIIINNIKLKLNEPKEEAMKKALEILGINEKDVKSVGIAKSSLDARKRTDIITVHSVCVKLEKGEQSLVEKLADPNINFQENFVATFEKGEKPLSVNPYVIGFGPAGMFAALVLARNGYKPIVLERGLEIEKRVSCVEDFWKNGKLNSECNVQFGEGGAGTFSDGKLTTRVKDPLNSFILEQFVKFGAPSDILFKAKPHIGTDLLRNIVKAIREEIIQLGGQIHFSTALEDVKIKDGKVEEIKYNGEWHLSENVILALGHSARDTFETLYKSGVHMENKPFSVGVRIEHLQSDINYALYGEYAANPALPQGEYQLSYRENDRAVYTFCMCPGGVVVPASSECGGIVTNGMSKYARNMENANSAIAVSVDQKDFGNEWNSGIIFQRKLEQASYNLSKSYKAPCQTVGNFINSKSGCSFNRIKPSYSIGVTEANFTELLPPQITQMMKKGLTIFNNKIRGFSAPDVVMTGIETRTSSPVRILRNEQNQSVNTQGIYPCGEGAGYAGGIMSAAIDGITVAKEIMKVYKPMN
ncbi:MAG: NAD(P)/FAD-dependent oxidoreductase [Oscillospiraceae bacterium]